jgi:acetate kinase
MQFQGNREKSNFDLATMVGVNPLSDNTEQSRSINGFPSISTNDLGEPNRLLFPPAKMYARRILRSSSRSIVTQHFLQHRFGRITPLNVLVLNPGSSTLKYAFYSNGVESRHDTIALNLTDLPRYADRSSSNQGSLDQYFAKALRRITAHLPIFPDVIGYRVVHGGRLFSKPARIDETVLAGIRSLSELAPLHQPYCLAAIEMGRTAFPDKTHVACFDTAFHASLPAVESRLPIPKRFWEQGVQRYGFHGLSYESIAMQLRETYSEFAQRCVAVCHLGNGASVCGMRSLQCCYTSMSFTPLDGLIMGTRSGQIDPGVVLHWLRQGYTHEQIERILLKESGLLGVSGVSSDMKVLLREASSNPDCEFAINQFCRSVARHILAAAVSMTGLDVIIFTAGIGENCPSIRSQIIKQLDWLGLRLDSEANQSNQSPILHHPASKIALLKLATDEQRIVARHAMSLIS